MSWKDVPICFACWMTNQQKYESGNLIVGQHLEVKCHRCARPTTMGIAVRIDPNNPIK